MAFDKCDPASIIAVRAPQYSANPRLTDLIGLSELQTSKVLGDKWGLAVALRVMHTLAVEDLNGGSDTDSGSGEAGAITEVKEGDLSKKRDLPSSSGINGGLMTTVYGQELATLLKSSVIPAVNRFTTIPVGSCA